MALNFGFSFKFLIWLCENKKLQTMKVKQIEKGQRLVSQIKIFLKCKMHFLKSKRDLTAHTLVNRKKN